MPAKEIKHVALVKINIKNEDVYFLMLTHDIENKVWCIHGFNSEQEGLDYFENGYHRGHARSYESSMSACINYIFFHPSIIKVTGGIKTLEKLVGKNSVVKTFHHISGTMQGVIIPSEAAKLLWIAGKNPSLWNQNKMDKIWDKEEKEKRLNRYET